MHFWVISNPRVEILDYVQGSLYFKKADNLDAVLDATRFYTRKEAEEFIIERNLDKDLRARKVTVIVW